MTVQQADTSIGHNGTVSIDWLRAALGDHRNAGLSWRAIARLYPGVPPGTLCAIAKGRHPRKAAIRLALGLPAHVDTGGAVVLAEPRECDCGCRTVFVPRTPNQKRMPGHPRRR